MRGSQEIKLHEAFLAGLCAAALLVCAVGCGATRSQTAASQVVGPPRTPLSETQRLALLNEAKAALSDSQAAPASLAAQAKRLEQQITPTGFEFELVHAFVALSDRAGQADAAERQVAAWRDGSAEAHVESVLSLWLGQRFARTNRADAAADELRRHIRTGTAVDGTSYVWAGAVALARMQVGDAANFFSQALAIGVGQREGPATPRALAQAGFGLALVRDLQGNLPLVDEALALGTLYDGGDALAKQACAARMELPVWGGAEARFLCGLIRARMGRPGAHGGFANVDEAGLPEAWHARLRFWRAREARASMTAGSPLRLLAIVTTRTDGPWPAPLFDVSWRRPEAFKACMLPAPQAGLQRFRFRLRVSLEGQVQDAAPVQVPEGWQDVADCFAARLAEILTLPPAPPGEGPPGATLALVEAVLTSP